MLGVLHGAESDTDQMVRGLRYWRTSKSPLYILGVDPLRCVQSVAALLTRVLLLTRGRDEAFTPVSAEEEATCERLHAHGYLVSVNEERRFSETALRQVGMAQRFSCEEPVFTTIPANRVSDSSYLMEHASLWQIFQCLQEKGWIIQSLAKKKQCQAEPHTQESDAHRAFLVGKDVERQCAYGTALLCSYALFAKGTLRSIHHGQPKKYYMQVLSGDFSGDVEAQGEAEDRRPRLQRDVDENAGPVQVADAGGLAEMAEGGEADDEDAALGRLLLEAGSDHESLESLDTHVSDVSEDPAIP